MIVIDIATQPLIILRRSVTAENDERQGSSSDRRLASGPQTSGPEPHNDRHPLHRDDCAALLLSNHLDLVSLLAANSTTCCSHLSQALEGRPTILCNTSKLVFEYCEIPYSPAQAYNNEEGLTNTPTDDLDGQLSLLDNERHSESTYESRRDS